MVNLKSLDFLSDENNLVISFENHLKTMAEQGLKLIEKKENKNFSSNKVGKLR